jgi:hypothetical protein
MSDAKKECFETTIQEICAIEVEIGHLVTKCGPSMAVADSVSQKVQKIARQLLTAADKIIDLGRDLTSITSCMTDVADNAEGDGRDLDHVPHMLAWAGWTGDLKSAALDTADDLIRAVHDLIGSSRTAPKARTLKGGS